MSDTKNMTPTHDSDLFKLTKFSANLHMNHAIILVVHLNEIPKPTWIIVMCSFCISKSLEKNTQIQLHLNYNPSHNTAHVTD
jgi:hypothetical protein